MAGYVTLHSLYPANVLLVRYESYLNDPTKVLDEIMRRASGRGGEDHRKKNNIITLDENIDRERGAISQEERVESQFKPYVFSLFFLTFFFASYSVI